MFTLSAEALFQSYLLIQCTNRQVLHSAFYGAQLYSISKHNAVDL